MQQEVVRDFLNLPGIAGVALMDGRFRPFFCGVDQTLNFQQKEALVQGIRQVVETTPEDFESFEFQFTGHQVYIYKLNEGIILLVLGRNNLVQSEYYPAIESIKAVLCEDGGRAIATFRLIASDMTMSGQNHWKGRITSNNSNLSSSDSHPSSTVEPVSPGNIANGSQAPPSAAPPLISVPALTPDGNLAAGNPDIPLGDLEQIFPEAKSTQPVEASPPNSSSRAVKLGDLLIALNHLSQFTTQYLGNAVIVNYWKSSRPQDDWLQNFQIDRNAKLTFSGSQTQGQVVSVSQQQQVQIWVSTFIKRCSQVIRDFPALVDQHALDDHQKALLLSAPPSTQ